MKKIRITYYTEENKKNKKKITIPCEVIKEIMKRIEKRQEEEFETENYNIKYKKIENNL